MCEGQEERRRDPEEENACQVLGGWDFSGAGLRAETQGWLHTGEQHEVLGEEPVHRHRALGPRRLLQTNQQDQGQPRYRLPSLCPPTSVKTLDSI